MRKLYLIGLALALVSVLVLAGCVPFPFGRQASGQQPYPYGSRGQQPYPYGPGGGMGPGMMGGGGIDLIVTGASNNLAPPFRNSRWR